MSSSLQLNLADLLRHCTVEGDRIEYKAGWTSGATVRTLCTFDNDFESVRRVAQMRTVRIIQEQLRRLTFDVEGV